MARPRDVTDPVRREVLERAEAALDLEEWDTTVHLVVDLYAELVRSAPEILIASSPSEPLPLYGRVPDRAMHRPWPTTMGVTFAMTDGAPTMEFTKEHFTMSEAISYFEYTLEAAIRAQSAS